MDTRLCAMGCMRVYRYAHALFCAHAYTHICAHVYAHVCIHAYTLHTFYMHAYTHVHVRA